MGQRDKGALLLVVMGSCCIVCPVNDDDDVGFPCFCCDAAITLLLYVYVCTLLM